MSRLAPERRRILACVVLYLMSAALLSWRLWFPDFATYQFRDSAKDLLQITIYLEIMFTALFAMLLWIRLPFLDAIQSVLKKMRVFTPIGMALASAAVLLAGFLVQSVTKLLPDGSMLASGFGYSASLLLWVAFLLARNEAPVDDPKKVLLYGLGAVPVLVGLSKLLLNGFAPAFYIVMALSISDLIFLTEQLKPNIRSILLCVLPTLLCGALITAVKSLFYSEILDFQLRSAYGAANSYSLGGFIDFLRFTNKLDLFQVIFTVLLTVPSILVGCLLEGNKNQTRAVLLWILATIFSFFWFAQAALNAEIMHRFRPFSWMTSAGLAALLANAVFRGKEADIQCDPDAKEMKQVES